MSSSAARGKETGLGMDDEDEWLRELLSRRPVASAASAAGVASAPCPSASGSSPNVPSPRPSVIYDSVVLPHRPLSTIVPPTMVQIVPPRLIALCLLLCQIGGRDTRNIFSSQHDGAEVLCRCFAIPSTKMVRRCINGWPHFAMEGDAHIGSVLERCGPSRRQPHYDAQEALQQMVCQYSRRRWRVFV